MRQFLSSVDYGTCEYFLAVTQLVLATLGMGVTLRPRDFGGVLRAPRALLLVFVAQLVLTPLLALALDAALDLPPGFALGMVLMTAMPAGAMVTIFVHLGRGQTALSLAATGLTTLASLITTTVVLHVFGSRQLPGDFHMPIDRVLFEFTVCLLLPLAVAMLAARVVPRWAPRLSKCCVRGSLVTLSLLILGSLTSGRLQIAAYGWRAAGAIAAFAALSLIVCYALGWVARLSLSESFTVGVLTTIRNGNLAILLKASLFPAAAGASAVGDAVLFVVLLYSGAALVVTGVAVLARRAKERRSAARPGEPKLLASPLASSRECSRR